MKIEKKMVLLCLLLCLTLMAGCGKKEYVDRSRVYNIYAVNKDETKVISNEYMAENTEGEALIGELLEQLAVTPEKLEYKAPLSGSFQLLGYSLEEGKLILKFDEHYKEQPVTTEVLVRAAIVRTMTQIKGVEYVSFQIRSEPLTDNLGNLIGAMSEDMFIDSAESEMSSKERVKIRLYFANEDGDKLIETNRTLLYSSYSQNISMEKLVLEQLINGPSEDVQGQVYPVLNPETKILGVTVKDGICYVNLDEKFLSQVYNVNSEVVIYSIANSLAELPNVNRVQIAVNGNSNTMLRENTSLAVTYERNLDLVTTVDEGK